MNDQPITRPTVTPDVVNLTRAARVCWTELERYVGLAGPTIAEDDVLGVKDYHAVRANAMLDVWIALVGLPQADAMRYLQELATTSDTADTRAAVLPF